MKFIDTFNEDDKKKLTKKAKLIYSVLKKSTITRSDGVKFSYELGNNMVPSVVNGEIELFAFITKITERTYCPINEIAMSDLIIKKFEQFDIKVDLQIPKSIEIVKYQGKKPWELNEEIDRAHLKKMKKKGELIYQLYKKGKLISDTETGEIHYTYELSDNKLINAVPGDIFVSPDNIKIKYHNELTNKFALLPILESIKKRFHNHGITFNRPRWTEIYIDEWKEPLNENHEEYKEKQIKKGKAVYYALKKGTIGSNDPNEPRFSYVLSDEFSIDINNLGILIFTDGIKIKELNRECNIVSTGYMQSKIRDRFEQFDIILTNRHLTSHDIEPWERSTINEEENNITEKDRKKIELIYGLFKRGKYTVEDILYNYVLPDEYWIYDRNETGELIVVLTMDPTQKMKLYAKIKKEDGNLYHREVPVQATQYASLYDDAKKRIKEKFERFNIEIVF